MTDDVPPPERPDDGGFPERVARKLAWRSAMALDTAVRELEGWEPAWRRGGQGERRWPADRGGPAVRAQGTHAPPAFLFAQMQNPELAPPEWRAEFVDYLYLSFTNATAFSPTDVLPLLRWAKLTMMAQSLVSLGTVAL